MLRPSSAKSSKIFFERSSTSFQLELIILVISRKLRPCLKCVLRCERALISPASLGVSLSPSSARMFSERNYSSSSSGRTMTASWLTLSRPGVAFTMPST
eukprot:scaffold24119_cov124-Skeletonema_dohrnii-CCMP3373.AAC.1